MPFESNAQRRFLYAKHPDIAEKWQAHTPKGKKLPEHVKQAAFFDEMLKIAEVLPKDLLGDIRVTSSVKDLRLARPGDIVITKPVRNETIMANLVKWKQNKTDPEGANRWTHSGIVTGEDTLTHASGKLEHGSIGRLFSAKVRQDSLKKMHDYGVDMMILRPQVSKEQKQEAIKRMVALVGTPYARTEVIRAAISPRPFSKEEVNTAPSAVICTAAVSHAYPGINFSTEKSTRHLLPIDILKSKKLKPIIAVEA